MNFPKLENNLNLSLYNSSLFKHNFLGDEMENIINDKLVKTKELIKQESQEIQKKAVQKLEEKIEGKIGKQSVKDIDYQLESHIKFIKQIGADELLLKTEELINKEGISKKYLSPDFHDKLETKFQNYLNNYEQAYREQLYSDIANVNVGNLSKFDQVIRKIRTKDMDESIKNLIIFRMNLFKYFDTMYKYHNANPSVKPKTIEQIQNDVNKILRNIFTEHPNYKYYKEKLEEVEINNEDIENIKKLIETNKKNKNMMNTILRKEQFLKIIYILTISGIIGVPTLSFISMLITLSILLTKDKNI